MKKSGIVTEINKKYICLLTSGGEFVKVRHKENTPTIGQIYTGDVFVARKLKMPLIAASLAFILFSGGLYSYVTPTYAVTVEINPSLKLHVNMWNRIVKAEAINEDGQKLLTDLTVTNMSIDGGLEAIISEAKKENIITEAYSTEDKAVKVTLEGKAASAETIKHFTETLKEEKINVEIVKDGTIIETTGKKINPNADKPSTDTTNDVNSSSKKGNTNTPKKATDSSKQGAKDNNVEKDKAKGKEKENGNDKKVKPSKPNKSVDSVEASTDNSVYDTTINNNNTGSGNKTSADKGSKNDKQTKDKKNTKPEKKK